MPMRDTLVAARTSPLRHDGNGHGLGEESPWTLISSSAMLGEKDPWGQARASALAPLPLYPPSPDGRERKSCMSPTDEQIQSSTETFDECSRLVHSGSTQAGIQYLMRRWRAIPEALQTRFLHGDFLTLPADTQAGIQTLLLVRSRKRASLSARRPCGTRCTNTGL